MEQVSGARAGACERVDPGSDEPFVDGIVGGGKDAIGRTRAILVGRLEGNGRSQWLRTLKRGRVVKRMDVEPGEEAPRVGRLTRRSERARGERQLPGDGRQGASERASDLRRAATGEEKKRRDDTTTRISQPIASLTISLNTDASAALAIARGFRRYPISISAGKPSRPIARRWRKCERSAARSDGCEE